ncbi:hypothetical protein [Klebsiella sp. Q2]|uniref:hypothetical protein n=1 Tax=Klebsiella sp. Q2 TaxID=2697364 RepID=UPI00135AD942|nr:hypothetical protein [Klebsiella sp. Q2]
MAGYLDSIAHPWTIHDIQRAIMSDFTTAQKSIDHTDGGKLWRSIKELDDAIWVFTKSTSDLLDKINEFGEKSKSVEFWHRSNENNSEEYVREVKRYLYYCTSSLMTVVDIARSLNKKWPLEAIVEHRNKFFSTPGLHDFLQKLRNFSSHWRMAQANWVIKSDFQSKTMVARFVVSKEELLEWGDWGVKAKKFIEDEGDFIDLYKVFSEYKKQVLQYYEWQKGALIDVYSPILQPFFNYKKMHDGLHQKMMWNMIMSSIPAGLNPYQYLPRYLSNSQVEYILSFENHSEQQVDALIKILGMEDFCDSHLKAKVMKAFNVSQKNID